MNRFNMTEEEKRLLADAFVDGARINYELLYSWQQEALLQLRAGKRYLEDTYPHHMFCLKLFTALSSETPFATLYFTEADSEKPVYTLRIEPTEKGLKFDDSFGSAVSSER